MTVLYGHTKHGALAAVTWRLYFLGLTTVADLEFVNLLLPILLI